MDHHGFVLGPLSLKPGNQHDTRILPETLTHLVAFTSRRGIALAGSAVTLDAGFDSQDNRDLIKQQKRKPVLYPNRRTTTKPIRIAQKFRWFERALYRERSKGERTLGWQDTYRKRVVRDDRLPEIRQGCRLLAYAMINDRVTFSPF